MSTPQPTTELLDPQAYARQLVVDYAGRDYAKARRAVLELAVTGSFNINFLTAVNEHIAAGGF